MNHHSQIKFYFHLQYLRITRILKDNGIYPWLAMALGVTAFIFITIRLLSDFAYGELIYPVIALSLSDPLASRNKSEFIQLISNRKESYLIRIIEQFVILLPFIIGLMIFGWYWPALFLIVAGLYLSIGRVHFSLPFSVPTPFKNRPFEFPAGFRKTIPLIVLSYALVPIGLSVGNINLALASIVAIGFIVSSYYHAPEPRFYVWVHRMTPSLFIKEKILAISRYSIFLLLPIIITILVFEPLVYLKIIILTVAAISFAVMCMLSKYLSYPQEINIVQGLAMLFSVLLPPIMLFIIPWFYFKSKSRLKLFLR